MNFSTTKPVRNVVTRDFLNILLTQISKILDLQHLVRTKIYPCLRTWDNNDNNYDGDDNGMSKKPAPRDPIWAWGTDSDFIHILYVSPDTVIVLHKQTFRVNAHLIRYIHMYIAYIVLGTNEWDMYRLWIVYIAWRINTHSIPSWKLT